MRQSIVESCQLPTELIIITTQRANNDKVTRHVPSSPRRREPTIMEVHPSWREMLLQLSLKQLFKMSIKHTKAAFSSPAANKV